MAILPLHRRGACLAARASLVSILALAALLRIWEFPAPSESREVDEAAYLQGGLQLIEGLPPTLHYAPDGPESWLTWAGAGALSARYLVVPTAEERQQPLAVRPYTAVNHALFDLYRDMRPLRDGFICISMGVSLIAVAAGFGLGRRLGGLAGAVMLAGLAGFTPVAVDNAGMAKPYCMAWSFSIIAFYFIVARTTPRGRMASAVFYGLAVASRIEMLQLAPLLLVLIRPAAPGFGNYCRAALRYISIVVVAALLTAPWLLTNLIGNLRAIATVRFGPPPGGAVSIGKTLKELVWGQGLLVALPMLLASAVVVCVRGRTATDKDVDPARDPAGAAAVAPWAWWFVMVYSLLMLASAFRQTGYGMRHQTAALLAVILAATLAIEPLRRHMPRLTLCLAAAAVLLPLIQSARQIRDHWQSFAPDDATAWVEAHVPPGTLVYFSPTLHDPLPTAQCADAMWDEIISREAADRKFAAGLTRFGISSADMPRALGDQNMVVERANVRRWFILGSRARYAGPRFDLRRYQSSATFGIQDPVPEFLKTGGVLIWRRDKPAPGLSDPIRTWTRAGGTYIYCSPDVRARISGDASGTSPRVNGD